MQSKEEEIQLYQCKQVGVVAALNSCKDALKEAMTTVQELEARIRAIVEDREEPLKVL